MPGILRCIQSSPFCQLLHDAGHVGVTQATRFDLAKKAFAEIATRSEPAAIRIYSAQ
jgi:hypothetical protein